MLGATHMSKKDYIVIARLLEQFRQRAEAEMAGGHLVTERNLDDCVVRELDE
jgi:hypothetical protein